MEELESLKKEDLSKILTYTVSQVEGKTYTCMNKRVLLPCKYFDNIVYYASILRCIVLEENISGFNQEIESIYNKWGDEFHLKDPTLEDYNATQETLASGDDLYTVLYIEEPIYSDSDTLIRTSNHYTDSLRDVIVLSNPRFSYLNELIDKLILYQKEKSSYIDYEEMKTIADNYIRAINKRKLTN